jgi:GxxExxY protein
MLLSFLSGGDGTFARWHGIYYQHKNFTRHKYMSRALIGTYARRIWEDLGPGFSERVYHNAMEVCLRKGFIAYETERVIPITFDGHTLGNMRADLIVDQRLIVELKSVRAIKDEHRVQTRLYLKLLGLSDALLVNFPTSAAIEPEIEQVSYTI